MSADPLQARFERELATRGYTRDPAQVRAVARLCDLRQRLCAIRPAGPLQRLSARFGVGAATTPVRGLYLWGGVGRGKTWLMDLFYESLPFPDRERSHFHRFMYDIHAQLRALEHRRNPLAIVAGHIAARTRVLCFDEFFVTDITDAMLLGTLFAEMFSRGVALVATSNVAPGDLYRNGLQRSRFLPAISLLETHMEILAVDGGVDYRLRLLENAEIYHAPLDEEAERNLARYFAQIAPDAGCADLRIHIEGRDILTRKCADGVVWFDFDEICAGPRSQADYIEIARQYQTVLISRVPALGAGLDDPARRFIALVDEFYDRNVKLIVSAAVQLDDLYQGKRLEFEFRRTHSRLTEMQSREYLSRPHLP